jgi:excisionase family DNA binding protein
VSVANTTWTSGPSGKRRVPISAGAANALPSAQRLMTLKEVAVACQLSEKAVRRAIDDGELVAIKLRSRVRISPDDFHDWIAGQLRRPHSRPRPTAPRTTRTAPTGTFRALFEADAKQRGTTS